MRAGSWSGKRQQRSPWNGGSGGRFVQSLSESLTEEDEDEDYPTSGMKKECFQYSIVKNPSRSIAGRLRTIGILVDFLTRRVGESFFDYEYLREFAAKIETARNVV